MANPNIILISDIKGKMTYANLTDTSTEVLLNAAASNMIYKVSSVSVANKTAQSASVILQARRSSVNYPLSYGIIIPDRTTVVLLDKNNPIYLEEGDSLVSQASVTNTLVLAITYEILS